jgi:hypothetical protein
MNEMEQAILLIAQQKGAKILKDDYKLGWLLQDETGYYWMVLGSSKTLELAMKCAKELIEQKGPMTVYVSDAPITRGQIVREPLPELKEVQP